MRLALDGTANSIDAAIGATYEIFGETAFQRHEDGSFTGRFNRAIFDLMILAFRLPDVRDAAQMQAKGVRAALLDLTGDANFSRWTQATTKNRQAVLGRVSMWAKALASVLGIPDLEDRMQAPSLDTYR